MGYFLGDAIDISRHNEDTRAVLTAFNQGRPFRVPVYCGGSIRVYLQNPVLNIHKWSFRQYFENVDIQIAAQVEYQKWERFNVLCDREMGLPNDGWHVSVDFQNSIEAAWMGCPIVYPADGVPDTVPILASNKEVLYDWPQWIDDNRDISIKAIEFFDNMMDAAKQKEYYGIPLLPPSVAPGEGTDGPLTLAYKLRGADNLLVDMLTDEKYFHDLMGYITENQIRRIKRMREYRWRKQPKSKDKGVFRQDGYWFADDAIALISSNQYKEYVFPYHKRFFDEFSTGQQAGMHLCGDATRHFNFLNKAFNIMTFDTGFPVDHGWLRKELGPDVTILGGPTIMELKDGSVESIHREVQRICQSGVMEGGRFVMIAANNMAPLTPVENIKAMYDATKIYGHY